jgi:hypothetical protein
MFIGHFTEQPWQDDKTGLMGTQSLDLSISNGVYDPLMGARLYNRYIDEKIYAEEMGFDGLMLNEHHSTPFCMQGVTNVGASILARVTKKAKIVILGNILPIWDDPLWLAEMLAIIDMISYGRLVSGFVRGGGRESVSHNAPPHYNRERFEAAHDFISEHPLLSVLRYRLEHLSVVLSVPPEALRSDPQFCGCLARGVDPRRLLHGSTYRLQTPAAIRSGAWSLVAHPCKPWALTPSNTRCLDHCR